MNRSDFLTMSTALSATMSVSMEQAPVPGGSHFVERQLDFQYDKFSQAVGRPARIRQLWEAVSFHPQLMNNIKNSLNGLQFGYGYDPNDVAIVVAPHGPSSAYVYTDVVWSKYSIAQALNLRDSDGDFYAGNVFLRRHSSTASDPDDRASIFQDASIQTLQKRGATFLACHTAIEEQSMMLVERGFAPKNMSAQTVADDILRNLIPQAIVVPSMVATIAILQATFRYTYVTLAI